MAAKRKPVEPQQLSLESLKDVDNGMLAAEFNGHLRDALLNCSDFPNNKGKRTVTIKLSLCPVANGRGELEGIEADYAVTHTQPGSKSRTLILEPEETVDGRNMPLVKAYFTQASNVPLPDPEDAEKKQ